MVNVLGVYNPIFYANEALIWLQKALGLANRVYMGFDEERRTFNKGDTISIRRPGQFTAQSAPSSSQAVSTGTVSISLSNHQEVKFEIPDKEFAYTGQRIISDHIMPAAYALADKIDSDLNSLIATVPHAFSEGAGVAATIAGLLGTRKKMFDNKVPLADQANCFFEIGGKEEADLLALSAFTQWQGSGQTGVESQMTALLGRRFGFEFFSNQNRPTVTYGDLSDFAGATTAIVAKGATSVPVGSLGTTDVVKKGTILKMTSGTDLGSEYAVTADVTLSGGAGTFVVNPPTRNAMGSGDTFSLGKTQGETTANQDSTVSATENTNVAFHRNWAALAFARLPDFQQFQTKLGVEVASVQDPVTGLALRARTYYDGDNSKMLIALDTLYGFKELDADLACRYEIANS